MDTIEQETPVGGGDVTPSQDTASDDTQPSEAEVVDNGDESVEEGEAPTLLAGKYKSPEELEKAYTELQSKLGQREENLELVKELEKTTGMNSQQIKDYLAKQKYEQYQSQVQGNPGLAAYQEVQTLKGQIALQNEEKELDKFLSSEEGKPYLPFKDKIFKLGLNLEKDKPYADIAREYFGESRAQGQQDAYKKIDTKRMTQSSGAKSAPQKRITLEDMKKMTSAEMEVFYHRKIKK